MCRVSRRGDLCFPWAIGTCWGYSNTCLCSARQIRCLDTAVGHASRGGSGVELSQFSEAGLRATWPKMFIGRSHQPCFFSTLVNTLLGPQPYIAEISQYHNVTRKVHSPLLILRPRVLLHRSSFIFFGSRSSSRVCPCSCSSYRSWYRAWYRPWYRSCS